MIEENTDRRRAIRIAAVQGAVLTVLCLLAFRAQIAAIFDFGIRDREAAHLLAAPILVTLLVYLRRDALAKAFTGPNLWGLGVVTAAILVHALFRWPFNNSRSAAFDALNHQTAIHFRNAEDNPFVLLLVLVNHPQGAPL